VDFLLPKINGAGFDFNCCRDQFYSRSHHAMIRVYDEACKLIEVQRHKGDFKNHDPL
jgi:hypothetical protein